MTGFNNRFYKKLYYIYWRKEAKKVILTQEEWMEKYREIITQRKRVKHSTIRSKYNADSYSIQVSGNYKMLFIWDHGYKIYSTNDTDDKKNSQQYEGSYAIRTVFSTFKEMNKISMLQAFGTVDETFKRNIPKQFYYTNPDYQNKELLASSIDVCSQYPSNMCGNLPDSHTAMTVNGYVKPTEEYPFAFYSSGHIAEYNKYDTHDWELNYFMRDLFRFAKTIKKDGQVLNNWPIQPNVEETTILMKSSKYTMDNVWNHFYKIKSTYPDDSDEYYKAKLVMNSAIGMMHTKKYSNYHYAHLVAVTIARSNNNILKLAQRINYKKIIQICVDGVIYIGGKFGKREKGLGNFYQEFTNCKFKTSGLNKYIAMENNNVVKLKHGNCNVGVTEEVTSLDDQYKWKYIKPLEGVIINEETI